LVAKNKTERAALDFAEQYGLDLVFLIPPLIVGPFICPRIPESVRWSLSLIFGELICFGLTLIFGELICFGLTLIGTI
jgi:nucleoside-diphosphate-sugar epimerase